MFTIKRSALLLSTFAGAALLFWSCCPCRKASPQVANLEAARWGLTEFRSAPVSGTPITLMFDAEKKMLYGTAPCNNFFGGYSLFEGEQNIKITNIGATRKYCPDTELEENFTRELPNITRIKIEGENLLMLDSEGNLVALLQALPAGEAAAE